MKFKRGRLLCILPLVIFWAASSRPLMALSVAKAESGPALVVPVTDGAVKLAFDVAHVRDVQILTYERDEKGGAFLHVWDAAGENWRHVDVDDVLYDNAFTSSPSYIIVIGPPKGIPTGFARALSEMPRARHIPTLETAVVINKLHGLFNFTGSEWRWFANRQGLKLHDRNYERRRWGKYGPPAGKSKGQSHEKIVGSDAEMGSVEVVDVEIVPTQIKSHDALQRTPRINLPRDKYVPVTRTPLEMEVTPVDEVVANPVAEAEPVPADTDALPEAIMKQPVLKVEPPDESPVLDFPGDSK